MAGKEGAPKPTLNDIEKASQTRLESQDRRESPEEKEKHEALQYLFHIGHYFTFFAVWLFSFA